MDLVFDIASSVTFWRRHYPPNRAPKPALPVTSLDCAIHARHVCQLMPSWADSSFLEPTEGMFHALTTNRHQSGTTKHLVVHAWSGAIPEGSFYLLAPHVLVESPAFMFLHAATILDLPSLIAFGDELCGLYSFDNRVDRGFATRQKPLLTKEHLKHYLKQAFGSRGVKNALKALPHIVEQSASPMETFDEMTMCLPYLQGGYGIPQPVMNQCVPLEGKAARIAKRDTCYLDMGYLQHKLDVEHHGKYDHSSAAGMASDRARVNGLKEMGFEVVELTSNQVGDLFAYEYIIQRIARILGKRLRNDALGATPQRLALRKAIFTWNSSYGKVR